MGHIPRLLLIYSPSIISWELAVSGSKVDASKELPASIDVRFFSIDLYNIACLIQFHIREYHLSS